MGRKFMKLKSEYQNKFVGEVVKKNIYIINQNMKNINDSILKPMNSHMLTSTDNLIMYNQTSKFL